MQGSLDPISQMIGALGAQVTNLSAQLSDLRAEILTNRTEADKRWYNFEGTLDEIKAEYRNVKHVERALEQTGIAIDARLKSFNDKFDDMDMRIRHIEDTLLIWRTRAALIVGGGAVLGGIIMYLVQSLLRKFVG